MKSQDTAGGRRPPWRRRAARCRRGCCAQNGVDNERVALRSFPHVYGGRGDAAGHPPGAGRRGWSTRRRRPGCSTSGRYPDGRRRDGRGGRRRPVRRPRSRRWPGPTSCAGSTASWCSTWATPSRRCAAAAARSTPLVRLAWPRARRAAAPPASTRCPTRRTRPAAATSAAAPGRRRAAARRIVVAEPRPGPGQHRDRLPQRRDRAARPAPRGPDPGQRPPPAARQPDGGRGATAGQRCGRGRPGPARRRSLSKPAAALVAGTNRSAAATR